MVDPHRCLSHDMQSVAQQEVVDGVDGAAQGVFDGKDGALGHPLTQSLGGGGRGGRNNNAIIMSITK